MKQDTLLITTFNLFVVNRFISFTVNPSNIQHLWVSHRNA